MSACFAEGVDFFPETVFCSATFGVGAVGWFVDAVRRVKREGTRGEASKASEGSTEPRASSLMPTR